MRPQIGRWVSRDPVLVPTYDYCYVDNNPLLLIDPEGWQESESKKKGEEWGKRAAKCFKKCVTANNVKDCFAKCMGKDFAMKVCLDHVCEISDAIRKEVPKGKDWALLIYKCSDCGNPFTQCEGADPVDRCQEKCDARYFCRLLLNLPPTGPKLAAAQRAHQACLLACDLECGAK